MKNHYELVYIIPVKTDDDDTTPIVELVNEAVKKNNGKLVREEDWGKRKLAYPIKNIQYGHYILNVVDFEPQDVEALDDKLITMREILRYQIIRVNSTELPKRIIEEDSEEAKDSDETKSTTKEKEEKKKAPKEKVSMEELDKKIDEILSV